jgi:hypothetical protein
MYDLSTAEDLKVGGKLIPDGTMVVCKLKVGTEKESSGQNTMHDVELEAKDAQYAGSKFFDNIMTSGNGKEWGLGKCKHVVEFSDRAFLPENARFYKINSPYDLNGKDALVKVKVAVHTNSKGESYHINKVETYISPRPGSSTERFYVAWAKGEQPWQTDSKPPLPNQHVSKSAGMPLDSEIPFG